MTSSHQDPYYEMASNRSPISNQRQHHTMHRTPSRHFDTYNAGTGGLYTPEDHARGYDTNRYAQHDTQRMNALSANYAYDNNMNGSQSWNANTYNTNNMGSMNGTGRMKGISRQRSALPTTWIDPPNHQYHGLNSQTSQMSLGPSTMRSDTVHSDPDEELIPTAIVIKNIPFAVKKEQLVQLMTDLNLPLPYAFNYHFDNGVFRGLAFANFTTSEETGVVIDQLNHFDLQGRKLRVEYKKMLPVMERERIEREKRERRGQLEEQHRPSATTPVGNQQQQMMQAILPDLQLSPRPMSATAAKQQDIDLNNPQTLQFYSQLLLFRDDASREALIFPSTLSPAQRRTVHTLAHHMSLAHVSRGSGDHRQVQVFRQPLPINGIVPVQDINISPPSIPTVMPVESQTRRTLARATTMDFSETRSADGGPGIYSTIGRQNLLDIPNSPSAREAMRNGANLRGAKSFADLRSYSPSPAPTVASFPVTLRENVQRYQEYGNGSVTSTTPSLTPTATGLNESLLVNGLAGVSLGGSLGGSLRGDPRSMSHLDGSAHGPIGGLSPSHSTSSRSFSLNSYDEPRDNRQGQGLPSRQPRGPDGDRSVGFGRKSSRQQLHSNRNGDSIESQSGVEIVVE